jgi:site-specific DNA-adenine methylase
MMKNGIARSPLFYVGDKYKLVREIRTHFPLHINRLIEPFVGGGSVMLNVDADGYLLNDIDSCVISLHRMLQGYIGREGEFMDELYAIIFSANVCHIGISCRDDILAGENTSRKKQISSSAMLGLSHSNITRCTSCVFSICFWRFDVEICDGCIR